MCNALKRIGVNLDLRIQVLTIIMINNWKTCKLQNNKILSKNKILGNHNKINQKKIYNKIKGKLTSQL